MTFTIRPRASKTATKGETMTEQQHAETVSMRNILHRARRSGMIDHVNSYKGEYMNMINAPDFIEAQRQIAAAASMFETVPAHIRADFYNDPAQFIDFMQNPENRDAIEEYGFDTSHLPDVPEEVLGAGMPPTRSVMASKEQNHEMFTEQELETVRRYSEAQKVREASDENG